MAIIMTKEKIKEKFLNEAIDHGNAISEGNGTKANKIHKKIQALYSRAKELEESCVFCELLDNSSENVRLWAATFTLKTSPDLAEQCLINLSKSPTITGLSAKTTLILWKQGKLSLL